MSIMDHVAILAHSSLDQPRVNALNPEKPASFFAQLAFPPTAGEELQALIATVSDSKNIAGLEVGAKLNSSLAKPLPGVPSDWIVVRASTQFAPYIADEHSTKLDQNDAELRKTIKTTFYAGKRVRAALSAYSWSHQKTGRRGVSFNLQGVMAAEDGERLNIGEGVMMNAFQKYAVDGGAVTTPPQTATQFIAQTAAPPVEVPSNPFQQTAATPFQQTAANPFA